MVDVRTALRILFLHVHKKKTTWLSCYFVYVYIILQLSLKEFLVKIEHRTFFNGKVLERHGRYR